MTNLAAVRTELGKTESAINRYMGAFENGVSQRTCSASGYATSASRLQPFVPEKHVFWRQPPRGRPLPTPDEISGLRQELKAAARHAQAPIRKDLAQSLVHELRVEGRERVIPTFKVVRSTENGRAQVDQANKSPTGWCSHNDTSGSPNVAMCEHPCAGRRGTDRPCPSEYCSAPWRGGQLSRFRPRNPRCTCWTRYRLLTGLG